MFLYKSLTHEDCLLIFSGEGKGFLKSYQQIRPVLMKCIMMDVSDLVF